MRTTSQHPRATTLRLRDRVLIGAALFLAVLALGVQIARAGEFTVNDHQMVVDTQGARVTRQL